MMGLASDPNKSLGIPKAKVSSRVKRDITTQWLLSSIYGTVGNSQIIV